MSENWVAGVVAEERQKDQVLARALASAVHRADALGLHLRCLMLALRSRVVRDVEAFQRELPNRHVSFASLEDGFTVRCDYYPEARLTVSLHPHDGTIQAQYFYASGDGRSVPKLVELVPASDRGLATHLKDADTPSFTDVAQLSEYLLRPLFTGHSQ